MKQKPFLLFFPIIIYLGIAETSYTQNYKCKWARSYDNFSGKAFALDVSGNAYTVGAFDDTADFDPGPGVFNLISAGGTDIGITKWDVKGNFVWAIRIGGTGDDQCSALAIDDQANIIFTGTFIDSVDFDPDTGSYYFYYPSVCYFVAKLDSSGKFTWAGQLETGMQYPGSITFISSVTSDPWGNIIFCGHLSSNMDFDPGPGIFNLPYLAENFFLAKYDSAGNFSWAEIITSSGYISILSYITSDQSGNIYSTGTFAGTTDFDPGPGTNNKNAGTSSDPFILKLDSNGNFEWVGDIKGSYASEAYAITVDDSANVYTTGYFKHLTDFDPGPGIYNLSTQGYEDVFISKLSSTGSFLWAKSIGGTDYDYGTSISVDHSGNVYTSGTYSGSVDFNPGTGTYYLQNHYYNLGYMFPDIFVSKLDASGNFLNAYSIGGKDYEFNSTITTSKSGDIFLMGTFSSSQVKIINQTLNYSVKGIFLSKLSCAVTNTINIRACHSYTSPSGNHTWNQSGTFKDTLSSIAGCDSILTINLVIDTVNTSANVTVRSCLYYTSPSGIYTWANSGIYQDTIPNSTNCDSVLTIDLTIDTNTYAVIADTGCNSYTSPSGNYTWYGSGTYSDIIPNAAGCDSFLTINLFLLQTYSAIFDTACNQYLSPSGNYIWNATGVYHDTLTNAAGCDSIITLILFLRHTYSTLNEIGCYQYVSPSGNHVWTSNGTYNDTIMNASGCDSIITIHLSLKNNSSTQNIVTCYSYTPPSLNYTWYVTGTYKDTVLNVFGCDSVITYNVTIKEVDTTVVLLGTTLFGPLIAASFQWLDCNNNLALIPGAINYSYSPPADGSFALEVTYSGCKDTSACYQVTGVGIGEHQPGDEVEVFPNPVRSECIIKTGKLFPAEISISDINGKIVFEPTVYHKRKVTLDLHALDDGIYFINIKNERASKKVKIMLIKQ